MTDAPPLAGKVCVLTGASKGLGPHLAEALVRAGCRVALLARPSVELDAVGKAHGDATRAHACDVSDPDAVRRAFAGAGDHFGRIDFLINNAAIAQLNRLADISDDDVRREVGVNFMGPLFCMRAAIPHMRAAGGGHIVNVSSQGVRLQAPYMGLYAATKGGLETLSAATRNELKADNIRVTVLRLGGVATGVGLTRSWDEAKKTAYLAEARERGLMKQVGRWMASDSVARTLVDVLAWPADVGPDLIDLNGR
jgi:meso-butanediol dehydrogenase / (S,S)-butanediol dehydrogenase / diacetyl reductase